MKSLKYLVVALIILALAACGLGFGPDAADDETVELPSDVIKDVLREHADEFTFETYVAVDLDLEVSVLDVARDGERPAARALSPTLIVSVADREENLLFRGLVDENGAVSGQFGIPTASDSVVLTIEGAGVETRSVVIEDPAELQAVVRDMKVMPVSETFLARNTPAEDLTRDTDGDGVPDYYDYDPENLLGDIAFAYDYPATGVFTVAYEDLFPEIGDGDFNDFVVVYKMTVFTAGEPGAVSLITGEATARARAAGYDHEFGIYLEIPLFRGTVDSEYESNDTSLPGSLTGPVVVQNAEPVVPDSDNVSRVKIVLFPSTKAAFDRPGGLTPDNGYPDQINSVGRTATFTVRATGQLPPVANSPDEPFDPYIIVNPATDPEPVDVHLIGKDPLPGSFNPTGPGAPDDFLDANDYPWALLVPAYFAHPSETTRIWDAYPGTDDPLADLPSSFNDWVSSGGSSSRDWYRYPDDALVVKIPDAAE